MGTLAVVIVPVIGVIGVIGLAGCGADSPPGMQGARDVPDMLSSPADMPSSPADMPPAAPVVFTDVTAASGLAPFTTFCLAFIDVDHDNRPDILTAPVDENGNGKGLSWFRNLGGGRFEEHPVAGTTRAFQCAVGDYDNDGWLDVAYLNYDQHLYVMRNAGQGGLSFDPPVAVIDPDAIDNVDVALADLDGDGRLDLYVGHFASTFGVDMVDHCDFTDRDTQCYPTAHPRAYPPAVYLNKGGGTFAKWAGAPMEPAFINAVSFIDWDGDGRMDVFESHDFGRNRLWLNGASGFKDVLEPAGANPYNHAMGVAFADFNLDGQWDFYVADAGPDQLWMGAAGGPLHDRAFELGVGEATRFHSGWSPLAADWNNDGYPDVFVGNSILGTRNEDVKKYLMGGTFDASLLGNQADFVLTNQGGKGFSVSRVPHKLIGVSAPWSVRTAMADFDGDGRVDLAEVYQGFRLLHNETAGAGHWLAVRATAKTRSRDGAGAVVRIFDGDKEIGRVALGTRGLSTSWDVAHFGLGSRTSVSAVEVQWLGGKAQRLAGPVKADQMVALEEQ